MMTDRELLELAAKAVGGTLSEGHTKIRTGETWDCWEWSGPLGISLNGVTTYPLTDDGDALRLAVKLGIDLMHSNIHSPLLHALADPDISCSEQKGKDQYAATRRAIVRAAAEIGKQVA